MNYIKSFFSKLSKIVRRPLNKPLSAVKWQTNKLTQRFSLLESLKNRDIQKKLLITFLIIVVYRILAVVPLPGIDISKLFSSAFGNSPLNSFFTVITGGRLDNPSVVAIGIGGYINASIIIQLLSSVIPKLEELTKEGERGKKILNQYTRLLAVPFSIMQAFVIFTVIKNLPDSTGGIQAVVDNISTFDVVAMIATLTAGSIILMWLGELITEYGIGNGISIILTVGILASLPSLASKDFGFLSQDLSLLRDGNLYILWNDNFKMLYAIIIGLLLIVYIVTYITEASRKIPIQYARRIRGAEGMSSSFLPLKINQAGVMPVIFASAILTFPQIISQLLISASNESSWLYRFGSTINDSFLGQNNTGDNLQDFFLYQFVYLIFIIIFAYFYTFVTYKPSETSDNLKKSGGFIPGLRPGKATERYITQILLRLTFVGSMFLGFIALLPSVVRFTEQGKNLFLLSGIGGTSMLIIIGVILETIRQIKSLTVSKSYDQYK